MLAMACRDNGQQQDAAWNWLVACGITLSTRRVILGICRSSIPVTLTPVIVRVAMTAISCPAMMHRVDAGRGDGPGLWCSAHTSFGSIE